MRTTGLLALTVMALGTGLLSARERPPQEPADAARLSREWKRLKTPSLTVVGNASERDLRHAAIQMERFRGAMRQALPGMRLDSPVPTTVIVFRDDRAFTRFKPRTRGKVHRDVAGYFAARPHMNYIATAPTASREFNHYLVFHEYTHYLVHSNFKRLPRWLDEGLAEFFSTFSGSERDDRTIVGRPIDRHVATLVHRGPMPLDRFVRPETVGELYRDASGTALLYAQSWALTHYLLLGRQGAHQRQLGRYVDALERGEMEDAAFREVFGPDLARLDRALSDHISRFRMNAVQLNPQMFELAAAAERMPDADAQQIQGDLLVQMGAMEEAQPHIAEALAQNPAHLGARLSLAMLHLGAERPAAALEALGELGATDARDPAVHFLRAEALRAADDHRHAVVSYRQAIALRPESPHAFYGMSLSQMALGDPAANASFSRCRSLSPTPHWFRTRLNDAMRLGIDRYVVADAVNYVQMAGWGGDDAVYVMLPAALAHLRAGRKEAASAALDEIEAHVKADSWQAALVRLFRGQLPVEELLRRARGDKGQLTEARAYAGILASIAGDRERAIEHLEWVKGNGAKDFIEYGFALGELRRLQAPAAGSVEHQGLAAAAAAGSASRAATSDHRPF